MFGCLFKRGRACAAVLHLPSWQFWHCHPNPLHPKNRFKFFSRTFASQTENIGYLVWFWNNGYANVMIGGVANACFSLTFLTVFDWSLCVQCIKRKVGEFQDCLHTHPALFPRELQKLLISAPCGKFPVVHLPSASVYSLCLQASLTPYSCGCGKLSKPFPMQC